MFTTEFDSHVVRGDSIACEVDGFLCTAALHPDEDSTPLDSFEDDSPYVAAWKRDEWHYFGVVVTVYRDGAQLTGDFAHARWGIDGNVPNNGDGNTNWYFLEVANDLLPEALADAKDKIHKWAKELNYA